MYSTPLQIAIGFGECGTGNNCGILVRLQPRWTWQQVNAQLSHIRLPTLPSWKLNTMVTLITVPLILALIAGAASFLPTLRISRIQPADTLRSE